MTPRALAEALDGHNVRLTLRGKTRKPEGTMAGCGERGLTITSGIGGLIRYAYGEVDHIEDLGLPTPDPSPLELEAVHYRDTTRIHHVGATDAVRATIMEEMGWEDDRDTPASDVPPGIIWETATDLAQKVIATLIGLNWMGPESTAVVGRLLDRADEALDKLTAERDALTAQLNTKEPRS